MPPVISPRSVAAVVARFLAARGIDRVFGLCGGHIMPLWMQLDAQGIRIVDVRDERAAVYMAHAHGEVTAGLGVALVTAGPGVTNAITGIANAHVARAPVLVLSATPPRAQEHRGALQDLPHRDLVAPITRYARSVRHAALALPALDEAVDCALGRSGDPGPAYVDFPADTLRDEVPSPLLLDEHIRPRPRRVAQPDPAAIRSAVDVLWSARKPLVISGRGARGAGASLVRFLDALGALYLDTGESRGLVPDAHPGVVGAMRGTVMGEADVVVTVGRRLDFQLAYGSPAVFGAARFVRIASAPSELTDNRRGVVELSADPASTLDALVAEGERREPHVDREWTLRMRGMHEARVRKLRDAMAGAPAGSDGRMHPNRLLAAIQRKVDDDTIVVADGGDFLSFARVGLSPRTYLDPGPLGCIGVGTPFGIAASLACPGRRVIVATGDGAFGFDAMEIDTAVRHRAPVLVVVANNGAWQIEVDDQQKTYGRVVGTRLRFSDYAAMARGLGMHAERVERPEDLDAALDRALAHRPSLLDVVVTPEAVSSDAKSGLAWVPDLQALEAWDQAERAWRAGGGATPE
jgi:acetolactate synthase-1/2/3 large subunit